MADTTKLTPGLAARKQATALTLRRHALELVGQHGYAATSTDDIARAAGVSPRTFFNYFPTKESAVLLPDGLLNDLVVDAIGRRPESEDPAATMAAAAMDTFRVLGLLAQQDDALLLLGIRVMLTEPALRGVVLERRGVAEEVAWQKLQERGVSPQDLGARTAVATVITLCYLALDLWISTDGGEPLTAVLARCLLVSPDPARLAAGVTATG
jgi:AcrR family transcriptional regulator